MQRRLGPGDRPSPVALASRAAREVGGPLEDASRDSCWRSSRGLHFPDCLARRAPPEASGLAAPRGSVGAVVQARDSQRRVRPGRAVAAGPPPGATLRRRRRAGVRRGPGPAGSGRSAAPEGQRGNPVVGRSCGSAGRGERAGGRATQAAGTEKAPPGCEVSPASRAGAGGAAWTLAGDRAWWAAPLSSRAAGLRARVSLVPHRRHLGIA